MMKKVFCALVAFLSSVFPMQAQTDGVDYSLSGLGRFLSNTPIVSMSSFSDGLALFCVRVNGELKHGYVDKFGKIVIPCKYSSAYEFNDGLAYVNESNGSQNGHFINNRGETVITQGEYYFQGRYISDGLLLVSDKPGDNRRVGAIDKEGSLVIPIKEGKEFAMFENGFASYMTEDNAMVIIDKTGKEVGRNTSYCKSGHPKIRTEFNEGIAIFKESSKCGAIDTSGNIIVPASYYYLTNFRNGVAIACRWSENSGSWGIIDIHNNVVVPFRKDVEYKGFSKVGLAAFKQDGKWGFINSKGEVVIANQYENACSFNDSLAWVAKNVEGKQKWGLIDVNDNVIVPFEEEFDDLLRSYSEGLALCERNGKYGFVDKFGNSTFTPNKYNVAKADEKNRK